jgi:hypothetical protein
MIPSRKLHILMVLLDELGEQGNECQRCMFEPFVTTYAIHFTIESSTVAYSTECTTYHAKKHLLS